MTETLTAEQIGDLEALLAKATPEPWGEITEADGPYSPQELANACAVRAVRNAAPALIAMAKQVITHESPAWDANERLNATVEELIGRAEKAEAEVTTLLARLQSTESAMGRAMELGSEWRKEAAKLRAQMLSILKHHDAEIPPYNGPVNFGAAGGGTGGAIYCGAGGGGGAGGGAGGGLAREHSTFPVFMQAAPTETPRTCETCLHLLKNLGEDQCLGCGGQQSAFSRWTPKPIPGTTDKGEKP